MDINNTKEVDQIIWQAFARASWVHKFLPFSFTLAKTGTEKAAASQK